MATVNFSIPDAIKKRFNEVFQHENKSHLIAELMKKAIEDYECKQRRVQAIESLLKIRAKQKPINQQRISKIRQEGRK